VKSELFFNRKPVPYLKKPKKFPKIPKNSQKKPEKPKKRNPGSKSQIKYPEKRQESTAERVYGLNPSYPTS
jgi:hypothetical protein